MTETRRPEILKRPAAGRRRPIGSLLVLLAVFAISCDSVETGADRDEVVFRTEESSQTIGALQSEGGDLIVYGWTGHLTDVRPSARTYPLILTIDPATGIRDTFIYRAEGFGAVRGMAEEDGQLVALIHEWQLDTDLPKYLRLDRIAPDGTRTNLCSFGVTHGFVLPSVQAGFHLFLARDGRLMKIDRSCAEVWSYERSAWRIAEMASGAFGVAVQSHGENIDVVRLDRHGAPAWTTTLAFDELVVVRNLIAAEDGLLLAASMPPEDGPTFLARLSASGELLWRRRFSGGGIPEQGLAEFGVGGFVLSIETRATDDAFRSQILRLDGDGKMRWHLPFGGWNRTGFVSAFVALPDGRVAAVGYGLPGLAHHAFARFGVIIEFIDVI